MNQKYSFIVAALGCVATAAALADGHQKLFTAEQQSYILEHLAQAN